ncbi:probable 3-hydroxyacyl-CoA dehydrogenase B0272.3 isoform X1 [Amyelois transitella]|uniref:probable 3-hydroxyacyl-CoA dehydrogenase B0272.3 isoform X1 n=1 Tax=Amyelois transitella TaxID=680683 RepID=UPI00298F4933|nr:probable 3-hydroxyacyl-CoA dehydrogenase B0272.3 isoform X1 [Amyelois transitella]
MNKLLVGASRNFSSSSTRNAIKTITVVGGGLMGSGIAQVAAQAGQNVTIVDIKPELLEKAQKSIQTNLGRIGKKTFKDDAAKVENFVRDSFSRIKTSTQIEDGVKADLIIEAIVEKLDVKQELFNKLDQLVPEHTILATNTSSISVNAIGEGIKRKDRFGGLHFFNPVPVMRLLEVIKGEHTSEQTYQAMMEWGKSIGKTCITCKDTPGFVVNRLLGPYSAEAIRMYERGDASAQDIDTAMKLGAGYPMGPLELADFTGLDTKVAILGVMLEKTGNPVFERIPLLERLVSEGKLGRKSGGGFYEYDEMLKKVE